MGTQKYNIIKSEMDGRQYVGIKIIEGKKEYTYKYVSENEEDIVILINRMQNEEISPMHFSDIVYDFIISLAYNKISMMTN